MIRTFAFILCLAGLLAGCGKKPNVMLPPNGNMGTDPSIYPYPVVQTPPPAPVAPQ